MIQNIANEITQKLHYASELYHRLLLIVSPAGTGKTEAFHSMTDHGQARMINISLELSRRLLDLTERQRALQIPQLLNEIINQERSDVILLDNIEILFEVSLKQDPLRLLQGLSRNRTLVVAWKGSISNGYLTYAMPEHPEYRKYPARELLIINPIAT